VILSRFALLPLGNLVLSVFDSKVSLLVVRPRRVTNLPMAPAWWP